MAITKTYQTKKECARLMIEDMITSIDSSLITDNDNPEWFENWEFMTTPDYADEYDPDYDYKDPETGLVMTNAPMWNTWFETNDYLDRHIDGNEQDIAELGFTLIYREGEFWGLGIDGCGYDFYSSHWVPLYEYVGLKWHDDIACPDCSPCDKNSVLPFVIMNEDTMNEYYTCPKCGKKLHKWETKDCIRFDACDIED